MGMKNDGKAGNKMQLVFCNIGSKTFVFYIENPHQTKNEKTKTQCKNKVNNCDSHANMDHFTVGLNLHRNIIS